MYVCFENFKLKFKLYKDQRSLIDSRRKDYLLSTLQPKRITAVGWLLVATQLGCVLFVMSCEFANLGLNILMMCAIVKCVSN